MWIKILCIEFILWRILITKINVWCCKYEKKMVKEVPINNHELLNIQACSFNVLRNRGHTQSLVVSWRYWIFPLISTRVSGYRHVILFIAVKYCQPMQWLTTKFPGYPYSETIVSRPWHWLYDKFCKCSFQDKFHKCSLHWWDFSTYSSHFVIVIFNTLKYPTCKD